MKNVFLRRTNVTFVAAATLLFLGLIALFFVAFPSHASDEIALDPTQIEDAIDVETASGPTACVTSISPTQNAFQWSGGYAVFNVFAPAGCSWTAVSGAAWVEVVAGGAGSGNGTVTIAVAKNARYGLRQTDVTVDGQIFHVTQSRIAGTQCRLTFSPERPSVGAGGGTGTVNFTGSPECGWRAVSDNPSLTLTGTLSGTGNGSFGYSLPTNFAGDPRISHVKFGRDTGTVTISQNPNLAPAVNAGSDQSIVLPNSAALSGSVSDDGIGNPVTVSWSRVSGPDTVIFSRSNGTTTNAIFNREGVYVLRLTASDGYLTSTSDIRITVNPDPTVPPPNPSTVAPAIDQTVASTTFDQTRFLFSGTNPIQTGVAADTIDPMRSAVLKGRVLGKNNQPLPLVRVSILDHPEFGQTMSRADGKYDLVVNGGGVMTVKYDRLGYLPVQRTDDVPWQDYCGVPDVVMMSYDPAVTAIDLTSSTPVQVARGTTMTDGSGTRRATLFFKQGTTASMTLPGGGTQALPMLNVRATEFTVGTNGPQSMPAALPPTSDYTYAAEFSVDEAVAANAVGVNFSQPVVQYLENFLAFPVGTQIPLGFYDKQTAAWVTLDSGRVVKVLSVSGGTANLDLSGTGVPATDQEYANLGINIPERQTLATLYNVGQTLWRTSLPHFSTVDANWPGSGNAGNPASAPNGGPPTPAGEPPNNGSCSAGSIIGCQGQTLGETVDLVGVPFDLNYSSDRTPGRGAEYTIAIPLSGASVPSFLIRIDLEVTVAGQVFRQSFPATPNQSTTFTWDGRDGYGRRLQGKQPAMVSVGFVYPGVYYNTVGFGYTANGIPILSNPTRQEVTLLNRKQISIGAFDGRGQGLGGWSFDVHHVYDPVSRTLYTGDGGRRLVDNVNRFIATAAGTGLPGFSGDGGPATQAAFNFPEGLDFAPDGSAFIADVGNRVVRRVGTNGIVNKVAGTAGLVCSPTTDPCGDGGPAASARLNAPVTVAFGPDGSYYIMDAGANRIRRVAPNGTISTIAGSGMTCPSPTDTCGDGGPAAQAKLNGSQGLFASPDGTIFIADTNSRRIRRIGTDGIINTIAGTGAAGCPVDNVPGRQACLGGVFGVVMAPDGTIYFSENEFHRIFKMGVDGILHVIAGTGSCGFSGDGGPAISAQLCTPEGIALGVDGSLFIADWENGSIRKIGSDGIIKTVAGTGAPGYGGDGGPAAGAQLERSTEVKIGPDNAIWVADVNNQRVRRINPPLPGFTNTDIAIPSEDGTELFQFTAGGRHLRTSSTVTGAVKYSFAYNSAGLLTGITDGNSNTTTVQRDGSGNPTGILSPYGQLTSLQLDSNGYISRIADPANNARQYVYSTSGLMSQYTTPRNQVYNFGYNAMGQLVRDDDPATGFQTLTRTDAGANYDVARSTALNRTTDYRIDQMPNGDEQRTTVQPDGLRTTSIERPNGTTTISDADGTVTNETTGGDPRFFLQAPLTTRASLVTPGGRAFNATFGRTATLSNPSDLLSLTSQTDTLTLNGRSFVSAFTGANRTFTTTSPVGRTSTQVVDAQERTTRYQFANLNASNVTYDGRGRPSTSTFGSGIDARTSSFNYNSAGFLSSFVDPLDRTNGYLYDAAGRVTQQTGPDGRTVGFSYDASGNLTSITPPSRPAHTFTYTPIDLLASYVAPSVGGNSTTSYTYDRDRSLTRVVRPDNLQINFAYDAAGRVQTASLPNGDLTYTYSPTRGQITNIAAPGGEQMAFDYDADLITRQTWSGSVAGSVSYSYDPNFRVAAQSVNGQNTVNFTYDNDDLLTAAGGLVLARSAQNGLIAGTTLNSITDSRVYNGFAETTNYNAKFGSTTLYNADYTYDKLGRVTQKVETIGGTTTSYAYGYDLAGRFRSVIVNGSPQPLVTYGFDDNDNRTSVNTSGSVVNATYDVQDRLTQYGSTTYVYTGNGELQSKTGVDGTTQYVYDVAGNLRSATLPNGTQISYVVDGQNRRIGKRVNGSMSQEFLYQDALEPVAELDGTGSLVSRFVYGSRATVPDYMVRGGATYRIISDRVGSVRLVVNASTGVIAQRIDYDEFGVILQDTNPGFQPFGFAGGLYDPQTKLTRFGLRDYDAEIGRWTAKDPIFFAGGETNLYVYAANDPLDLIDPTGTSLLGEALGRILGELGVKTDKVDITGDLATKLLKDKINENFAKKAELQREVDRLERKKNRKRKGKKCGGGGLSKLEQETLDKLKAMIQDIAQEIRNLQQGQMNVENIVKIFDLLDPLGSGSPFRRGLDSGIKSLRGRPVPVTYTE